MRSKLIHTGGRFDPGEQFLYFIAANTERLGFALAANHHPLVALNELEGPESMAFFLGAIQRPDTHVFLDSGVYNFAMTYARQHGVSMDIGLSMNPSEMEGFESLFDRYVEIVRTHGKKLWCYIEIDQGGRENKIKTRARLEKLGLRPTPVYHPLNDGWDYFDYLAERYDRICFGNIVQADLTTRKKLIATAWERHRRYPDLWIHLLGFTPNQWLDALPINSCDSSTWMAPIRWPTFPVQCDGAAFGQLEPGYRYELYSDRDDPRGHRKGTQLCAYKSHMDMRAWQAHTRDLETLGFTLYPPSAKEVTSASH